MQIKAARRWLAGLGVMGMASTMLAATATPAAADPDIPELGVYFENAIVAAGGSGVVGSPILSSSTPTSLHEVTVTFDTTGLTGVAEIAEDGDGSDSCTPSSNTLLVCTAPYDIELDEWGISGLFRIVITPSAKAADGDQGTLKVSFAAQGLDTVTHEARVRVGEGIDLAAGPTTEVTAEPGGSFAGPLTVHNAGETAAKGVSVVFYNDYAIRADQKFSNCTYVGESLRSCHFDMVLEPGMTYGGSMPYKLGADTRAPGFTYGEIVWMTPAEFEDLAAYLDSRGASFGEPGTGSELTISAANVRGVQGIQVDTEPQNNWSALEITVTGENGTDLVAVGDTATGRVGQRVTVSVGFRNDGPAALDFGRSGSSVSPTKVLIPNGTTAVTVPEACYPVKGDEADWEQPGEPGATEYRCRWDEHFIGVGESMTIDFELRIDEVIVNDSGTVTINAECQCDGFSKDINPQNDTAKIIINPSDGGTGGGLPVTGGSTAIITVIGALLIIGGFGFVLARRRRVRFVA